MFAVEGNSYRVFESADSDASDAMRLIVGTYFLAPACTTIIYYWICTLVEQGLIIKNIRSEFVLRQILLGEKGGKMLLIIGGLLIYLWGLIWPETHRTKTTKCLKTSNLILLIGKMGGPCSKLDHISILLSFANKRSD